MLIDINLLQEKEKRFGRSLIIILSVIILFFLAFLLLFIQVHSAKSQLAVQTEELNTIKEIRELEEQSLASGENVHSVKILESSITWAEQSRIDIVMILQQMTKLLPKRGFIEEFTYMNNNTVELKLQFEESKHAAFYLTELSRSKLINDAKLLSVIENDPIIEADYSITLDVHGVQEIMADRGKK